LSKLNILNKILFYNIFSVYQKDLESELNNEEKGPLGNIFRSLASGDRPSGNNVDSALAQEEAQQLFNV
jgi:hypothetical protein